MMLHVILHQLCQSGKLLPTIEVIVVSCVLDFNMGDGSISPAEKSAIVYRKVRDKNKHRQTPAGSLNSHRKVSFISKNQTTFIKYLLIQSKIWFSFNVRLDRSTVFHLLLTFSVLYENKGNYSCSD